ncbi:hypothetical protein Leryth_026017 [Lithospermum erythrorhizon]|nr:hypothetical protein Leryth_026017 [Lithospermum erythrorhizon]
MGHIWDHAFYSELKIDPSECKILLTDPPLNPSKNHETMKLRLRMEDPPRRKHMVYLGGAVLEGIMKTLLSFGSPGKIISKRDLIA